MKCIEKYLHFNDKFLICKMVNFNEITGQNKATLVILVILVGKMGRGKITALLNDIES